MTKTFICTALVCVSMAACGNNPISTATNSAANSSNVSFGMYDVASTSTLAVSEEKMAANTAMATRLGGGGGGGREQQREFVPAKMSLSQSVAASIDTAASDRKIIRNAELDLETDSPEDSQRKITAIAELRGGFVVESQQSSSEVTAKSRDIVSMTVRVPSATFSDTLADIRNTSTRVVMETVKGQDVTEEFIDIEAQLKAKKALEQQFMEIMKRAHTVGDALDVHSQLADVRSEIERIEGRKRFLENQSSMSTIKIRLQTAKVFAATSVGFSGRLGQSFSAGADVALNFVLGLVTFVVAILPFALFIGLPVFGVIRYVLKRQSRPRTVVELAEEELKST